MTANDSDVSDGDTLTGSQVVRVYGQNLTSPFVTLTFGEVEYTPLTQGEDYIEFILGDNGTATISVDGSSFMSFEVEGIIIPSELPKRMLMFQSDEDVANPSASNRYNVMDLASVNCINYNYGYNESYQYFGYALWIANLDISRLSFNNCTINKSQSLSNRLACTLIVTDTSKPAYIELDDFIIAVFNYTTD